MKIIALCLILSGFILLSLSLRPTKKILRRTQNTGWTLLSALIMCFLAAYAASFIYILFDQEYVHAYLAHGTLLAGGGLFVFLVTRYCYNSLLEQEYQASHDRVTQLKNRHSFNKSISMLAKSLSPFYIMLIDLNGFKKFNDAFGHPFGDELLRQVAEKLSKQLPEHCRLYRVGGDEFAILGHNRQQHHLEKDIKIIQQQFEQPISVRKQNLHIGFSIGVSSYPTHSNNVHELVQQAEQALYAAKSRKRHWKIYSEDLNKNALEHLAIANKLQNAIDKQQFQLFYQPIIKASNHSIHGAEVLLRWKQADGSYIPPDTFIPIAEQSTLIHDITCWVIKQAIEDLAILDKQGFTGCLHINLSAKDLHNNMLLTCLDKIAAKVTPQRIIFEVTESAMMTDIKQATKVMVELVNSGFAFSLDDFGTGFSSFPLLRDLPLEQIKIDRSFVINMASHEANQSIVRSIIFLAKSLNCTVVAEGVEDNTSIGLLQVMGCHYLQGYFFSRPVSLEQYQQLLDALPPASSEPHQTRLNSF